MLNASFISELEKIVNLMSVIGDPQDKHRIFAYQKAIGTIREYNEDIANIDSIEKLNEIKTRGQLKGIGNSVFEKMREYVQTGKLAKVDELRKLAPPETIFEFTRIRGVGPVGAKKLFTQYNVATLDELIEKLEKEKLDEKLLVKAKKAKEASKLFLLNEALAIVDPIVQELRELECVEKIEVCGGIRRRKPLTKDADVLVVSNDIEATIKKLHEFGTPEETGGKKAVISVGERGFRVELTFTDQKAFYFALLHFTGSVDSNIRLRQKAIEKDYLLSQDGLFDRNTKESVLDVKSEEEIFEFLGCEFLPPELRDLNPESRPRNLVQIPF
jgi:DNA polymerase (family 10)